jgi:hypothetical protein
MSARGTTGDVMRAPRRSVPGDVADAEAAGAGVALGVREQAAAAKRTKRTGRADVRITPFLYHGGRYCTFAALRRPRTAS